MSGVVLEKLNKTFRSDSREIHAVRDLSITIRDDELVVFVGPSGCGKTTTLRLIAGLEKEDTGSVSIDGKPMNQISAKDRDCAMVFQQPALLSHMNVFENIAFGLMLRKFTKSEIETRVRPIAEALGLSEKLRCRPSELSGGEAQCVALGRAVVRQPKLFLLDEPLSSLDAPRRKQLRQQIVEFQKLLKVPMIYVTHDQREALQIGQRIAVMNRGELQQIGTAPEIRGNPANNFVAEFFGEGSPHLWPA